MNRSWRNRRPRQGQTDAGPLFFVLGLFVGLAAAIIVDRMTATLVDRDIELVRAVRDLALQEFVSDLEPDDLIDGALHGMLEGLDEYSRFYGPEEIARLDRETSGEFRGVGVVFRQPPSDGQVLFPFPGSPAARAGVLVGDRLLEVEGLSVEEMQPGELQRTIRGVGNGVLHVLTIGLDGSERRLEIETEPMLDPTVRHTRMLDSERGIGYLAILSFSRRTPEEFDEAVEELRKLGLEALVVDLRSNPGGILEAAVRIANRFIGQGTIVATRTRTETILSEADTEEARYSDTPLVCLIDEGSASASEVLVGALQDHCAALLVGEETYGKGTVQTLRRFGEDRAIVKLTTAVYYTPSGRRIERNADSEEPTGISPDYMIGVELDERRAIYEYLATYSPPLEHAEAIARWERSEEKTFAPLPPADRQLDVAIALLSGETPSTGGAGEHGQTAR